MHSFVLSGLLDRGTRKTERMVIRPALSRDLLEYVGYFLASIIVPAATIPPTVDRRTQRLLFGEKVNFLLAGGLRGRYITPGNRK
ncbi:hypothetical protein [Paenibacillus silagei]|uniref:Uncharacterized protein n=1 Tax=Paenibacillus silagei TaxID=1670801 RepID=A0ABS4NUY5_9BACL|nr:hypothetical protein [Paenibacillus silagei]MBP2113878.1 hypothetical protein [Paenibacillus silagei]